MTFREKLLHLIGDQSRANIARKAQVPATVLTTYVNRGSEPSAANAMRLARVLNVPTDWLVDDEQVVPPPTRTAAEGAADLTDHDLLHELAKRYRRASMEFQDAARRACAIDWKKAADLAETTSSDTPLPAEARRAMAAVEALQLKYIRVVQSFDVQFYSMLFHDELPGAALPLQAFELGAQEVLERHVAMMPELRRFNRVTKDRPWLSAKLNVMVARDRDASDRYADAITAWTGEVDVKAIFGIEAAPGQKAAPKPSAQYHEGEAKREAKRRK